MSPRWLMLADQVPRTVKLMTDVANPTSIISRPAPNENRGIPGLSRAGALAGFAGALFYATGSLLSGTPPRSDAAPSVVVAFLIDKRDSLLSGFALELVALGLLVCFLGQLRRLIADGGEPIATAMTAAWVVLMTTVLVGTLPALTLVWEGPLSVAPGLVRMTYDMEILATYAASATAAFVSIGAPSLVIWRRGVLPRWLAVVGMAAIAANAVELAGLASRHGALAGGYAYGVGALLWVVWVAAASVCMALRFGASSHHESMGS
jgi:hypothetical protein